MKVVFALLGLILVGYAAAQTLQEQCAAGTLGEGYFSHDRYCDMFYTCDLDNNWRESSCYYPFLWNAAEQGCDYDVDCGNLVCVLL